MSKNYSKVGGENVRLLQALIDEAPSYTKPTNSRNANILKSIINNTEYNEPPQSEIEELLIALKAKIGGEIEVNELTVTENGNYDAGLNKAYNPVNVELPLDSKEITANGTYNASDDNLAGFSQVTVNVEGYKLKDIPNTPTAIATFTDGSDLPMAKLEVSIEPQQDLHGYDAPWVWGAGRNLFNMGSKVSTTIANLTVSSDDDYISFNGTKNGQNDLAFGALEFNLKSGTYYAKVFNVSGMASVTPNVYVYKSGNITQNILNSEKTFTLSEDSDIRINFNFPTDNATYSNYKLGVVISKTSGIDKFYPYSNICPISGWDEVNVSVSGVNVWDEEWESGALNSYGAVDASLTERRTTSFISVVAGGSYYMPTPCLNGRYAYYDAKKNLILYNDNGFNTFVNIVPDGARYLRITLASSYGTTYNNDISINYPSTDTNYHAYNGQTYTIDLDGTRYGGKVDLVSGVMTVDRVKLDLGSRTYNKSSDGYFYCFTTDLNFVSFDKDNPNAKCEIYKLCTYAEYTSKTVDSAIFGNNNSHVIYIADSRFTDVNDLKTALNGVQLVYELATPLTIQLTPTAVKSLEGVNNVWADCGDVLGGKYFAEL